MPLPPLYDPEAVKPMWEELTHVGVTRTPTPEEVDQHLKESKGSTLVIVNSVCGCAAGSARPGVAQALQNKTIPDSVITVFAGVERDATDRARSYMQGVPPSSPCMALFKDGELVHMLERRHIEMMNVDMLAENLVNAFNEHCEGEGPSVSPEEFAKTPIVQRCGSGVPKFEG